MNEGRYGREGRDARDGKDGKEGGRDGKDGKRDRDSRNLLGGKNSQSMGKIETVAGGPARVNIMVPETVRIYNFTHFLPFFTLFLNHILPPLNLLII